MPQWITFGNIAQARGDLQGASWMYQTAANLSMNNNLITSSYFVNGYNLGINDRKGLGIDLVPGYLQLQPDVDQLRAFEQLESWYIQNGQCEQAKQTWNAIKIYQNGGVLENGSDLPACTEK
ncbi:MAG: hypothetical protein IMZ64_11295 [Bacteroidetes bacterium]|nr:hypothetical protein [Bacteroidota bacterium]